MSESSLASASKSWLLGSPKAMVSKGLRKFEFVRTFGYFVPIMLTGYSSKAYQGMGDAYLLPSIAVLSVARSLPE
jgi:hypothetical protein